MKELNQNLAIVQTKLKAKKSSYNKNPYKSFKLKKLALHFRNKS